MRHCCPLGEASEILASHPDLSHLFHEAFASALDQTLLVAGAFGLLGTLAVFTLVKIPRPQSPAPAAAPAETPASR